MGTATRPHRRDVVVVVVVIVVVVVVVVVVVSLSTSAAKRPKLIFRFMDRIMAA